MSTWAVSSWKEARRSTKRTTPKQNFRASSLFVINKHFLDNIREMGLELINSKTHHIAAILVECIQQLDLEKIA
jgi:aspartate aminotransferase-like enzyme